MGAVTAAGPQPTQGPRYSVAGLAALRVGAAYMGQAGSPTPIAQPEPGPARKEAA